MEVLEHYRYIVKPEFTRKILRHGSQLRVWPGDVGSYSEKRTNKNETDFKNKKISYEEPIKKLDD